MKLLIVEDDLRIAASLKKGLQQDRYTVDMATDGTSGYDLASTETYDAIVLDYMLPGMDGLHICQSLRKAHIYTPIIMLTAKNNTSDITATLDAGADDYLTKPFSFEELLARIRAVTRRPTSQVAKALKVADLTLDPQTFSVVRSKTDVHLTHKEYSLLEYLMRHQGVVMTKDQIIKNVWDFDADILPNTIEVYMRKLREKIDIPFAPSPALIQTVRGFGYKIIEN
ncbi:MAG: response regulator transcription factor [Candidatus Roizmanbacteria bacterium]